MIIDVIARAFPKSDFLNENWHTSWEGLDGLAVVQTMMPGHVPGSVYLTGAPGTELTIADGGVSASRGGISYWAASGGSSTPDVAEVSTQELLQELSLRMRTSQNSTAGEDLGKMCDQALVGLDRWVLDYRRR